MCSSDLALADYAAARRRELTAALAAGDAAHLRTFCLGIVDQEAMQHLVYLTRRVRELLEQENPRLVLTHAYEGGHPDHDAASLAVKLAPLATTDVTFCAGPFHEAVRPVSNSECVPP